MLIDKSQAKSDGILMDARKVMKKGRRRKKWVRQTKVALMVSQMAEFQIFLS
jgi:hypothetical protein